MHCNNIRDIFLWDLNTKMSHLCIAEQTAAQVEQTKQGVRSPLPPPQQKRVCIYGALPRLPLGNAALFLKRQGHRELSFSGRQHTVARTLAHAHLHVHKDQTPISNSGFNFKPALSNTRTDEREAPRLIKHRPLFLSLLAHSHLYPSKALIQMETLD